MVVRKELHLKSKVQEQSPEVSLVVENNNLEVDEDRMYEPSVGDKVEGNGNSDRRWVLTLSVKPSLWAQGTLPQSTGEAMKHEYDDKGCSSPKCECY